MSAINPASFQTPVGGLQIPGGVASTAPNTVSTAFDQYPGRRQQRQHPVPTTAGTRQAVPGASDHTWISNRDDNGVNSMVFQQPYGQTFPGSDLDVRQLDQYSLDFRQGGPQVPGVHSFYNSYGYNAPSVHHSSLFASRSDSSDGGVHSSQIPGRDWNQSFQGLSLGQ